VANDANDKKYMELVPVHIRNELSKILRSNLSLRERWEIAKTRAEAQGNARMVVADFLIEEGLMKRVFGREKE
jgi:hypothetical protein